MTPKEILIVIGIAILLTALIIWSARANRYKKSITDKPQEDPWDHLSSNINKDSSKPKTDTTTIKINRNDGWEFEPTVGESATPWLKPDTNTVLFYEQGTVGGTGLVGWIESREIANHLRKEGVANAEILSYDKRSCEYPPL